MKEKENLTKCRLGQGIFRKSIIDYWSSCSVTKYKNIDILIASHIKPWKSSSNEERLDVYNGFLLTPNLDKLFDKGYISFNDNGEIMIADILKYFEELGLNKSMKIEIEDGHKKYLKFHRENVFQEI
jgi:predicted restriction endonuclease